MSIQDEIPKSRLTLKYKTEINGQPADIELPFRMLMLGDFSHGSSKDRNSDLEDRQFRNLDGTNLNAMMKDMDMSVDFNVPNKIDPANSEDLQVKLPINNLKSFDPGVVADNVPKLKGLLMLKSLLKELIANADNRKDFRRLLSDLLGREEDLKKLLNELKSFEGYKLPQSGAAG